MTPRTMQWIGKYEKVRPEPIGSGGFGSVYLAYDHSMDRQVAIKVLTAPDDASLLARFRSEARALAALQHPNIVIIFETGEDHGMQYLVMEYVDGRTLKDLMMDRDPIPLWRKVDIMSQVAEGLDCAHRQKIVHRDVKPANIMVRNADGAVKILDFGIARLARPTDTRTESGLLMGTIPYMAPEQFDEGGGDVLCDLWAYGIIYYELLTGRHPFGTHETKPFVMASRIREQEPEAISVALPDCPPALERVVRGLLTKKREDRFQSFSDVQFEIQPLLLDLKKQHAAAMAGRAEELLSAGDVEGVSAAIRTILSLDPANTAVGHLRERQQQAAKQRDRRTQVHALIQLADSEESKGRLAEAIQALERAEKLDPTSGISTRLESLRIAFKQSELARRLVAEARKHLEEANLTEAFKAATAALTADPQDAEAAALLEQIRGEIEQRERQRNLQRGMNRARGLVAIQSFDEALALLNELGSQYADAPGLEELIQEARRQKEERTRRERLTAGITAARDMIRRQALREAVQALDALVQAYPAEREPADLLRYASEELAAQEARATAEAISARAEELARERDFDAAMQLLERSIRQYPGEESLPRAMRSVLAARAAHERERALQDGLARARKICEQGAIEEALALAASLERDYPERREPPALREELLREQAVRRRRRLDNALAQSVERERSGDFRGALRVLEDGLKQDPDAPELRTAAEGVRQRKAAIEKQRAVDAACAEIDRLLNTGQIPAAREAIDRARRAHGADPRFDAAEQRGLQEQFRRGKLSAAEKQLNEGAYRLAEENLTELLRLDSQDTAALTMMDSLGQLRAKAERREAGRREAGQLIAARRFEEALRVFDQLLQEFSDDAVLKRERQAAWEAGEQAAREEALARELERKQALAAGRKEAERLIGARNFDGAIQRYQQLVTQFPGDPLLAVELRAAQDAKDRFEREALAAQQDFERKQALAAGRAEAQGMLAAGKFEAAIQLYRMLTSQHPQDALLTVELRAAEEAKQRFDRAALAAQQDYERKQALSAGRKQAERLLATRNFDAAIELYRSLAGQYPDDALLPVELRAAEDAKHRLERDALSAKADYDRKQALAEGRAEAERLLQMRNFDAAIQLYQALTAQYPNDPLLAVELRAAQAAKERSERDALSAREESERKQAIATGRTDAKRLVGERKFDAAIQVYQSLLARFPDDPLLPGDLRETQEAKERIGRDEQVNRGRQKAAGYLRNQDFDKCLGLLRQLGTQFPDDTQIAYDYEAAVIAHQEFDRKQALAAGRAEAERLLAERKFDAAIQRYQLLMVQFPNDPLLPDEFREAHLAKSRFEQKEQVTRGRAEAGELMRKGEIDRAITFLESLARKFPDDLGLGDDLREAVELRKNKNETLRRQTYQRARGEAERLAGAGQFAEAIRRYEALDKDYPNDAGVRDALASVKAAQADADRRQAYLRARVEAERLAGAGQLDEAIRRYEALEKEYPNDAGVRDALASVRAAKTDAGRRQAYLRARGEAERAATAGQFDEAIRRYEALEKEYPEDAAAREGLASARNAKAAADRRQNYLRARGEAERAATGRQFDDAIRRYEALVKEYPDDAAAREGLAAVKASKTAAGRRQTHQRAVSEAERLANTGAFDDAIRRYEALLKEDPEDAAAREGLAAAKAGKTSADRQQVYQRGRSDAEKLSRDGKFQEALRVLEGLLGQFPGDRALQEDIQIARKAHALQEQRVLMDSRIAELEKLRDKGDAAGVKQGARSLLAQTEEPRARALLGWAEAALAGTAPKRKLTWVWASLPALAVAGFGYVYWTSHRPPGPASLDVKPASLSFTWKQGTPPPDLKKITVAATGAAAHWAGSSAEEWLIAEPIGGSSSSQIGVSINTSKISVQGGGPTTLSGMVKVTGGNFDRVVQVTLTVQPENNGSAASVKPAPVFDVSPTDLPFRWKPGTPLPGPQFVSVRSDGGKVDLKPPDVGWLIGKWTPDHSRIEVSVNPGRITGRHEGLLRIVSGDQTRMVEVVLMVEAPDAKPVEPGNTGGTSVTVVNPASNPSGNPSTVKGPETAKAAEPPLTDKVDCHSKEYGVLGMDHGRMQWSGQLAPNATLWLAKDPVWKDPAGPGGTWKGRATDHLPGCAVDVAVTPDGVKLDEAPSAANNFGRLRLKNASNAPVNSISVQWTVK